MKVLVMLLLLATPDGGMSVIDKYMTIPSGSPSIAIRMAPPDFRVSRSDGGTIIMSFDELYDLFEFAIMAKKREEENGACVPSWREYPFYPPDCSFSIPKRLQK